MGAEKIDKTHYSFEEYLELETQNEERHEFHDGEVLAMSGGTSAHSKIANSIGTAIDIEIDKMDNDCSVFNSDIKIYIEIFNHCVYPDVMALCGEEDFYDENNTIITNPLIVIEMLSQSTKGYDKGLKFDKYRTLPSLKEYILVWQTLPKVESWFKEEENLWRISRSFGLDASISLNAMDCQIALSDIYKRIDDLKTEEDWNAY